MEHRPAALLSEFCTQTQMSVLPTLRWTFSQTYHARAKRRHAARPSPSSNLNLNPCVCVSPGRAGFCVKNPHRVFVSVLCRGLRILYAGGARFRFCAVDPVSPYTTAGFVYPGTGYAGTPVLVPDRYRVPVCQWLLQIINTNIRGGIKKNSK